MNGCHTSLARRSLSLAVFSAWTHCIHLTNMEARKHDFQLDMILFIVATTACQRRDSVGVV